MARHRLYPESVRPGIPKMPPLPPGWQAVPFGELLAPVSRPADLDDETTYQLVTAKRSRGGIVPREELTGVEIKTKTQFYVRGGDFLISRRQIIHGACGFVPEALNGAVVSGEYDVLEVKPGLLPEYLEAFTHTTYFQQTCFQSSVGVDIEKMVFDLEHWFTYRMPLPPLAEQRRIAGVLGRIKAALRANERALEQARRVKRALLQRLLSEGVGHARFKETEIGRVPEGWDVRRLGELAAIQTGLAKNERRIMLNPVTVSYLRVANVQDGYVDLTEVKSVQVERADLERFALRAGDVLMNEGGDIDKLGRGTVWEGQIDPCIHQNHVFSVRADSEKLLPRFLAAVAESPHGRDYFAKFGKQTTNLASISQRQLAGLCVPLPSLEEQTHIVNALLAVDRDVERCQAALSSISGTLAGLRNTLLSGSL